MRAQPPASVPIGAIYPAGAALSRAAVATALSVINERHEPIPVLMGAGGGIDRLAGAPLRVVDGTADDPVAAETEAERLITAEHVVALVGGETSEQDAAIRRVAMRHGIPYLSLDRNPAPAIGLTWGFNLAPTGAMQSAALIKFLQNQAPAIGHPIQTLGLVYEDRPASVALSGVQRKLSDDAGYRRVAQLVLRPDATDLATEVETIVEHKPDALLATLDTGNAILLVRSLAARKAAPLLLGQGGFCRDPAFLTGLGAAADGVICATSFAPDAMSVRPGVPGLAAAFQARAGVALTDEAAQVVTAVLLLADVIDRAGSTQPLALRTALMATDTAGDKLATAWGGVRFDDSGQNVLAAPALRQVAAGVYRTVAPAEVAVAKPVFGPATSGK